MSSPMHSVSCTAVVIHDGKVLAIKRADDGRWVPPGGVMELEETPGGCVEREVREETGLKVRPVRLTGIYKNIPLSVVSLAFLCELESGELTATSEETAEARWLSLDEAEAMMPEARWIRVSDAVQENAVPFVRVHDGNALLTG